LAWRKSDLSRVAKSVPQGVPASPLKGGRFICEAVHAEEKAMKLTRIEWLGVLVVLLSLGVLVWLAASLYLSG